LIGAVIGLIWLPARLKYLEAHWRRGRHVYIEPGRLKDALPFFIAMAAGLALSGFAQFRSLALPCAMFGCILTWGLLANYLWWRSLPE
jgi:hypothetical protein